MPCSVGGGGLIAAAIAAGIFADIRLYIVKNWHQCLAVRGQAVVYPGRDLAIIDALHQPIGGQLL